MIGVGSRIWVEFREDCRGRRTSDPPKPTPNLTPSPPLIQRKPNPNILLKAQIPHPHRPLQPQIQPPSIAVRGGGSGVGGEGVDEGEGGEVDVSMWGCGG